MADMFFTSQETRILGYEAMVWDKRRLLSWSPAPLSLSKGPRTALSWSLLLLGLTSALRVHQPVLR